MKAIATAALLCIASFSFAQSGNASSKIDEHFIAVTGTATLDVVPDIILLDISLTNKIIDKQQFTIERQEAALKKILSEHHISLDRLTLKDANADLLYGKYKEIGFEYSKTYSLKLTNASEVSQVIKELQPINIRQLSISKLDHSKIDSLNKVVRIQALKAAKEKAAYLLEAIGERPGQAIEIAENNDHGYFFRPSLVANTTLSSGGSNDDDTKTSFDKITIRFSYDVKYAILQ